MGFLCAEMVAKRIQVVRKSGAVSNILQIKCQEPGAAGMAVAPTPACICNVIHRFDVGQKSFATCDYGECIVR